MRSPTRRLLGAALTVPGVATVVLAAPAFARSTGRIGHVRVTWLLLAVLAEVISLASLARLQGRMLAACGHRVPVLRLGGLACVANAFSATLPGGSAFAAGYTLRRLRSWGVTASAAAFTVVASGAVSAVAFAAVIVAPSATSGRGLRPALPAAAVLTLLAIALLGRGRLCGRVIRRGVAALNRVRRRPPTDGLHQVERFVADLRRVRPRSGDWLAGFAHAAVNWLADLACLVAGGHAVGVDRPDILLLASAYVLGMTATTVSALPAGGGLAEAAMILTLRHGGMSAPDATACVLLYRLISVVLVAGVGWTLYGAGRLRRCRYTRTAAMTTSSASPA
jgi:uncharacterized protein (TIRG00374 family)